MNVIFLLLGGISLFDSVCTAFGTAGTGGFELKMTVWQDIVLTFKMYHIYTLFGVNFSCWLPSFVKKI